MDSVRPPGSPRESWIELRGDSAGESSSDTAAWNPTKRRRLEQDPGTDAEAVAVRGAPCPHPPLAPQPAQQGRHLPGTHMIVVVLDPGTDLQLRLGREVLVLAPQAALQLTLRNLVLVVVPAHVLRAREPLWFPAHARWLRPLGTETSWEVDIEDGSLSAQRAERHGVRPAEEEREAPRGGRPSPKGASATHVPGSSPSSLHTLLLRPLSRGPAPQGCWPRPQPSPPMRPLPAEFRLDLRGLGPRVGSALRPLPPSPSPGPGPRTCRVALRRPPAKARRRLF